MRPTTLRPGLLVSLKTTIKGNVTYAKRELEADHLTEEGMRLARWETERTITDPVEHEQAVKVRGKARTLISGVCALSSFGLLCPENRAPELEKAIREAREIIEEFNVAARTTNVSLYVIAGRIASDDAEAARAIASEVRDLINDIEAGVRKLDVEQIRGACNKARNIGQMLSPEAAARIAVAIETSRKVARKLVQAGEEAAKEIDAQALRALQNARVNFLDMGEEKLPEQPQAQARAIDLDPARKPAEPPAAPVRQMEL